MFVELLGELKIRSAGVYGKMDQLTRKENL